MSALISQPDCYGVPSKFEIKKNGALVKVCDDFDVVGFIEDIDRGNAISLYIQHLPNGVPQYFAVPFGDTKDSKILTKIFADKGIVVNNVARTIQFISDSYEDIRGDPANRMLTTERVGFCDYADTFDGGKVKRIFVLDDILPRKYGLRAVPNLNTHYRALGDPSIYFSMLESEIFPSPTRSTIFLLSAAAPLWYLYNSEQGNKGFVFNVSAPTSMGKTSGAIELAASFWGKPEKGADGIIKHFNATDNAFPVQFITSSGLITCIDDGNASQFDFEEIKKKIYEIAGGTSKLRCTETGALRKEHSYTSLYLFTTESSILGYDKSGGNAARIIEFNIPKVTDTAEQSRKIRKIVKANYALLREYIEYLMELYETDKPYLDALIEEKAEMLKSKLDTTNAVCNRLSEALNFILVANELFSACFKERTAGINERSVLNFLLDTLHARDPHYVKDRSAIAFQNFLRTNFKLSNGNITRRDSPSGGVLKNDLREIVGEYSKSEIVLFRDAFISALQVLKPTDYKDYLRRLWKVEKIFDCDDDRPTRTRVVFGGKTECYIIKIFGGIQ